MSQKFGLNSYLLHIIAMFFMTLDHLWGSVLYQYDILTILGRIAMPIFAFLLVEGFHHTSNRKKYMQRLLIFAIIAEIPFNLFYNLTFIYPFHQNVLFTFLLGLCMMSLLEKAKMKKNLFVKVLLSIAIVFLFYILGFVTLVDYFGYGIMMVALFYFTRINKDQPLIQKVLLCILQVIGLLYISEELIKGLVLMIPFFGQTLEIYKQSFSLLALPFIWLYNGEKGPNNPKLKYFNYIYYPLHLLILALLMMTL